jgi:hypothetical protein
VSNTTRAKHSNCQIAAPVCVLVVLHCLLSRRARSSILYHDPMNCSIDKPICLLTVVFLQMRAMVRLQWTCCTSSTKRLLLVVLVPEAANGAFFECCSSITCMEEHGVAVGDPSKDRRSTMPYIEQYK